MEPIRNKQYISQARTTLVNSFQRISCAAIDTVLRFFENNFTEAFHFLAGIESQRLLIKGDGAGHFDGISPHIKVFIKSKRKKAVTLAERDEHLAAEIDAIPELNRKEKNLSHNAVAKEKAADDDGQEACELEIECLCCYGDYPLSQTRECMPGSGHHVCQQCIHHFVSEQLDGNDSTVFKCIVNADCQHEYSMTLLDQVLSPKLNKRANDRIFREEMKKADIGSDWTCPHCAYIGFVEGDLPAWIQCPECDVMYCTGCNDIYHENKTCNEVRKDKELQKDPKHRAHEAMSRACKRFCPHCKQEYMKSDGCNKIRCKCKTLSCYICGEQIEDYSHFCNHKLHPGATHCTCGKSCRLWTSNEEMEQLDRKRRQEAGRKVLIEAGIANEEKIQSILASPTKKDHKGTHPRQPEAHAAPPMIPPLNNRAPRAPARPMINQLNHFQEQLAALQELRARQHQQHTEAMRQHRRQHQQHIEAMRQQQRQHHQQRMERLARQFHNL